MASVKVQWVTEFRDSDIELPKNALPKNAQNFVGSRIFLWPVEDRNSAQLLTVKALHTRANDIAVVSQRTYSLLGGREHISVDCTYRKAKWLQIVAFSRSAQVKLFFALLTGVSTSLVAWLGLQQAAEKLTGLRWSVSIAVFVVGLVLALRTLFVDVRDSLSDQ